MSKMTLSQRHLSTLVHVYISDFSLFFGGTVLIFERFPDGSNVKTFFKKPEKRKIFRTFIIHNSTTSASQLPNIWPTSYFQPMFPNCLIVCSNKDHILFPRDRYCNEINQEDMITVTFPEPLGNPGKFSEALTYRERQLTGQRPYPLNTTLYNKVQCHSRYGTIKSPPCSIAVSAERIGLNFATVHRQWWRPFVSKIFHTRTKSNIIKWSMLKLCLLLETLIHNLGPWTSDTIKGPQTIVFLLV